MSKGLNTELFNHIVVLAYSKDVEMVKDGGNVLVELIVLPLNIEVIFTLSVLVNPVLFSQ